MGRLLEGSRSGYDAGLSRPPRAPAQAQVAQEGQAKVPHYCAQGRGPYGTRRSQSLLAPEGPQVSRRRIGRGLHQAGLRGTTRRQDKAPTTAGQAQTAAPHQRNQALTVPVPDNASVGDLPYLPTGEGWRYLAVVLELGSRAVVGGAMADPRRAAWVHPA
jgi:putative transposase